MATKNRWQSAAEVNRIEDAEAAKRERASAEEAAAEARRRMVRRVAMSLPASWRRRVVKEYERLLVVQGAGADGWLLERESMTRGRLPISANDSDIRDAAGQAARVALELVSECHGGGGDVAAMRAVLVAHCEAWEIAPADGGGDAAMLRMVCERWWLRRLRASVARRCEAAAVSGRLVCRGVWPYASQDGVERRKGQRRRNAQAMASAALRNNETGEEVSLADVASKTTSNPENRRNELMTRVKGCDLWAVSQDMGGEFWTLTAPGRCHSSRIVGGQSIPNDKWDGATPKEVQGYLCGVWARARAEWARRGLRVFGMRVAEPHHDATPHWHILAFGVAADLATAGEVLRAYALEDSPDESGASERRFVVEVIDRGRGGAAAYLAKYVSKNIDALGVDLDEETGGKAGASVIRCDTWAAAWRIRQFQFFGCPAVGVWRELRKMGKDADGVGDAAVEAARVAAVDTDWCAYCEACGGCAVRRADCLVWCERGGEDRLTEYGDAAAAVVIAIASSGGRVPVKRGDFSIVWGALRRQKCAGCAQDLIDFWLTG